MPVRNANGIDIDYEEFGSKEDPALVLIRGLGTQRIQWPERLLDGLVARGLRVVCPDNRDVGLSQKFTHAGVPDIAGALAALQGGESAAAPYSLADMALDVVGLLEALEVERAHVVGISMGGMIAQHLAASHGDRLLTMTSIMSSSGALGLPPAKPAAMEALLSRPANPDDRESVVSHNVRIRKVFGGSGYPTDDDVLRAMAERVFDRCYCPDGAARQLLAVLCDVRRCEMLAAIEVPTLVIHGEDDPLVPIECGLDTAERIPAARFESVPGMGHDLSEALSPTLVELIAAHAKRA